mmetsp:Transcript_25058/g.60774  ORF Transcript_25058/g.60774 Transcript_25058/m.60774 type:complete len:112 (+) Transcript_25058:82-417(+)
MFGIGEFMNDAVTNYLLNNKAFMAQVHAKVFPPPMERLGWSYFADPLGYPAAVHHESSQTCSAPMPVCKAPLGGNFHHTKPWQPLIIVENSDFGLLPFLIPVGARKWDSFL